MPSLVANIQYHDHQFSLPTARGAWKWVVRLDVSQSVPSYQIRDVVTPWGLLRDSIPIPGDVIIAMSDAITELKANFVPGILIGPPSSLTFTVDEGRGFYAAQSVLLTNVGVYGSLLGATLTSSASFIRVTPANVGNLALNESGQFDVSVDSTTLVATSSPYAGTIMVQDPTANNTPQTLPITINVRPKSTITLSPTTLTFSAVKPLSGPFAPVATQTFQVQNTGPVGSVLDFTIQKLTGLSDWLVGVVPSSGSVAGGSNTVITLTVAPLESMMPGTYTETLRVSGYSSNSYQDIQIQLVIT